LPLPELEPGEGDQEIGYRITEWDNRARSRLIEALINFRIRHRFEDEQLMVPAADEAQVDSLYLVTAFRGARQPLSVG
jgi:ABC-type transport system involved in Fe-S cluster assembly fused permease/ATPase subunit